MCDPIADLGLERTSDSTWEGVILGTRVVVTIEEHPRSYHPVGRWRVHVQEDGEGMRHSIGSGVYAEAAMWDAAVSLHDEMNEPTKTVWDDDEGGWASAPKTENDGAFCF